MIATPFKSLLLTAVLAMSASAAQASVIDFSTYPASYQGGAYGYGEILASVDGYTLRATNPWDGHWVFIQTDAGAAAYGTNWARNGTNYLEIEEAGITLNKDDGTLFSLTSIDLATSMSGWRSSATLTGTFANGKTKVVFYSSNNDNALTANDFTTLMLTGFTNLVSFNMTSEFVSVDNIMITPTAPATTVPEPASLAILGLGLVGIGAVRRSKKK